VNLKLNVDKLDFGNSIAGFEHLRYFLLEKFEGDNPFFILRSKEEGNIEFVVVSPFEFYRQYEIEMPEELKLELQIESPEAVMVLCMVTIHKPFTESTLNLVAPLVINVNSGMSRQLILNGSVYQARSKLFPVQREEA
jgi:flagellar assembly factor FliW